MTASRTDIRGLIAHYGVISDQVDARELTTLLDVLGTTLAATDGAVVEFGCYIGTTSLYIRRMLDLYHDARPFHVYDSFAGLPEKTTLDVSPVGEQFKAGELAVTKKQFLREFQKAHLQPPIIHKAWFHDITSDNVPNPVAFAFLDGDYYDSIKYPLELLTPKLATGAVIVIDDYVNEALPGAARAADEWCGRHGLRIAVTHSLAIIKIP